MERTRTRPAFQPWAAAGRAHPARRDTRRPPRPARRRSAGHERRFSAELSHELRTPLARIIAEAELALRRERKAPEYRETLGDVLRNARQVARIIDALVAAARREAAPSSGTADAFGVATSVAAHCESLAVQSGVTIQVEPPSTPVRLGVDGDLAERILHPVVENACRYGATTVRISVARTDGRVIFSVRDDGSGVGHDEHTTILSPGHEARPDASRATAPGSGLHLRDVSPAQLRRRRDASRRSEPLVRGRPARADSTRGRERRRASG